MYVSFKFVKVMSVGRLYIMWNSEISMNLKAFVNYENSWTE